MTTKTDGISSGLVAVAHMMQSPDGQCMGFLPFAEEGTAPVVRLSDAEAIIAQKRCDQWWHRVLVHNALGNRPPRDGD